MRQDKLTTRFQEALADAQSLAVGNEQQYIEPLHLLAAMLHHDDGAARTLLQRAGGFVDEAVRVPTDRSVAEASVAVAEAKVLTTKIALQASTVLFELGGTRTTFADQSFDRHWRNARTLATQLQVVVRALERCRCGG